ncbi:MAG: hypothetical protein NTX50_24270, partial [Candidatus Sumerlaeota bacterium]|nr:hypothetical protein [Candidatus Sumerlaeota bacterium]
REVVKEHSQVRPLCETTASFNHETLTFASIKAPKTVIRLWLAAFFLAFQWPWRKKEGGKPPYSKSWRSFRLHCARPISKNTSLNF